MTYIKSLMVSFIVIGLAGTVFVFAGVYPMGADKPHNMLTYWLLETLREKSIARAARDIDVPILDDPDLLLAGGPDYNEMCATCHLKPGKSKSDMSIGLYPAPPNLTSYLSDQGREDKEDIARRQFWVIKHGIKASGMPAWGPTHSDQRIWAMVAFLQKLPELNAEHYQILTTRGKGSSHDHH